MRVQFRACIVLCSRYRMLSARDFNFDEDTDKRGGSEKGEKGSSGHQQLGPISVFERILCKI